MEKPNAVPQSLNVVAALFLVFGLVSAVEVAKDALQTAHLSIDLGVLYLFVGYGLLRRRSLSRRVALIAAWLTAVAYPILLGIAFAYHPIVDLNVSVLGQSLAPHSPSGLAVAVGVVLTIVGASGWVIWTLERESVKRQFVSE